MKRNVQVFSLLVGIGLLCAALTARADKVDDYIQGEMKKRQIPGVSVAVVREGKVLLAKGYGAANVEHATPATADTVYELASVTKQFTATAIMMLAEEGKLALDDKITKHLTGLPTAWENVTVRHLLNHTSGIKSYTSVANFFSFARKDFTQDEILQLVAKDPLEFQPGEKWNYNNTGYFLLGMIVEKVSGQTYEAFLKARIFQPLGMNSSRLNNFQEIIPNRAQGYALKNNRMVNCDYLSPTQPFSAGALLSTVSDMAKWDAALYTEKLLKKSSLDAMWTETKLADGKMQDYGFGWSVGKHRGHKMIGHSGGINGFSTHISRFVDDKLTVIVLANSESANAGMLANGIAANYLKFDPEVVEKPITDKDPKTTEMLERVLRDALQGKVEETRFTPEAYKALAPRIKESKDQVAALGELKSFVLLSAKEDEKNGKELRYRAVLTNQTVIFVARLTPDNKIMGLGIRPE